MTVFDFYDNSIYYTPPCCRPGGRCTQPSTADTSLTEEQEDALTDLINSGASMREIINYWREAKDSNR
jgi:hypothetical protein